MDVSAQSHQPAPPPIAWQNASLVDASASNAPLPLRRHFTEQEKQEFLQRLVCSDDAYWRIKDAPQRTDDWLKARMDRITGSNFGSAAGHNPYCSPEKLVIEMLWRTFTGNEATEWGTKYEDRARDAYISVLRSQSGFRDDVTVNSDAVWCDETGLLVVKPWPYAGISPDGIVHVGDGTLRLLEIKCPFRKRLYGTIPPYYYDQIQGIMGMMRLNNLVLEGADFVVWTPTQMSIQHYPYNKDYFEQHLFPAMQRWYAWLYLPSAIMFRNNELEHGETAFSNCVRVRVPNMPNILNGNAGVEGDAAASDAAEPVLPNADALALLRSFM